MKRKLLFIPKVHYTENKLLNKIFNVAKEQFGDYYPVFLDPANCQYNENEIRVKELEKKTQAPLILCFANFTRTLNEDKLWWNRSGKRWEIYFWCSDEKIRHVQELTSIKLNGGVSIKGLYERGELNNFKYFGGLI